MIHTTLRRRFKPLTLNPTTEPTSDDVEAAVRRLFDGDYQLAVQGVACEFQDGILTLTGKVPLYYHKQLAQTIILEKNIPEIELIVNEIEVT